MLLFLVSLVLLATRADAADENPKAAVGPDPVAGELQAAKDVFRAALEKADEALLEAFDKQVEKLKGDTKLKVEDQIKRIEELQAQRKLFEAKKYIMPSSPSMKDAVSRHRLAAAPALARCEKAFDAAAEKYRAMKDLASAKVVLEEKRGLVQASTPFDFEGVWFCRQASGWSGRRVVKGDVVTDEDGRASAKWERDGGKIILSWSDGKRSSMDIDFKRPNQFGTPAVGWTRVK
jgi:hypothetical protein